MRFTMMNSRYTHEHLGLLPSFLSHNNPEPARAQLDANYKHGGGFTPMEGFKLVRDGAGLQYPGDPMMHLVATAKLRDETINVYNCDWVAIIQPDGSFVVARMD